MLIDTTLREGMQRFGLYLSMEQKLCLTRLICELGVDEMEMGVAGRDHDLGRLIKSVRDAGSSVRLSVWSPFKAESLAMADKLGIDVICTALPVSDLHLDKRLSISRDKAIKLLEKNLSSGFKAKISLGLEDISRADPDFALEAALKAQNMGVWRIRMSDSVGMLCPQETASLVERYAKRLHTRLAFHGHNDLGMATANAVTALSSGCDYVDVSVLGIGERSGIARLEEIMAWLCFRKNRDYRLDQLPSVCSMVASLAGISIDGHHPVVGTEIFNVESGLHVDAVLKHPALFEPFDPELLGLRRRIRLGGKSGKGAVRQIIRKMGRNPDAEDLEQLVCNIRELSIKKKAPLEMSDLEQIT